MEIIKVDKLTKEDEKKEIFNVAACARVSTGSEDQLNSFESQKKYYENKINQNENWILINKIHFFLKMNIIQKQVMQCFILLVVKTIMFL